MRSLSTLGFTVLLACLWPSAELPPAANSVVPRGASAVRRLEDIPPRPLGAATGSEFVARTRGLSGRARQALARRELAAGNLPDFLRNLRPIELTLRDESPVVVVIEVWVTPDYLAIGSDEDFLRIPLDLPTATAVAAGFGCVLPTTRIVDAIYEQSDCRLEPRPMRTGPKMRSSEYYLGHQKLIEEQRSGRPEGELVSGHKKDLVITDRLRRRAKRVAIYGWHRSVDDPIQPLSTVHGAHYADYSHGVRLVWRTVFVDGRPRDIGEVLTNPSLAPALAYEGAMPELWRLVSLGSAGPAITSARRE